MLLQVAPNTRYADIVRGKELLRFTNALAVLLKKVQLVMRTIVESCPIRYHVSKRKTFPYKSTVPVHISGLCSNALAFASANAAFAFALAFAFDCPVVDAFALAFDSSAFAFALAFDSNAFGWNQMHLVGSNAKKMRRK